MWALRTPFLVVEDGQKAIDYLSGVNGYSDRHTYPFPCLVLLDIKLPGISGFDVLRWMRQESNQQHLKELRTVIFTSSDAPQDIHTAYSLGANGYLTKLPEPNDWTKRANAIKEFWLIHNTPPLTCLQAAEQPLVTG